MNCCGPNPPGPKSSLGSFGPTWVCVALPTTLDSSGPTLASGSYVWLNPVAPHLRYPSDCSISWSSSSDDIVLVLFTKLSEGPIRKPAEDPGARVADA